MLKGVITASRRVNEFLAFVLCGGFDGTSEHARLCVETRQLEKKNHLKWKIHHLI